MLFKQHWNELLKIQLANKRHARALLSDVDIRLELRDGPYLNLGSGSAAVLGCIRNIDKSISGECLADIGRHVQCNPSAHILCGGEHSIADHVNNTFSASPLIYSMLEKKKLHIATPPKGPVKIGSGVIIGTDAIVLSGSDIGEAVLVGAGSVVTKSYVPYSVIGGNPAKVLRLRPDTARNPIPYWDLTLPYLYQLTQGKLTLDELSSKMTRRARSRIWVTIVVKDGNVEHITFSGLYLMGEHISANHLSPTINRIFNQLGKQNTNDLVLSNDMDSLICNEEKLLGL